MSSKKLLKECRVYWSNCEVWTNEVICKFWRSSDVISLLHTSEKYPLRQGLRLPTLSLPSLLANIPDIAQRQGFPLKEQTQKIHLEEWNSEPLVESSECTKRQVFRWLVKATEQLQVTSSVSKACSFIEMYELCGFAAKKIQMLDLGSDGFDCWQSTWLCLWWQIDQNGQRAFQTIEGLA